MQWTKSIKSNSDIKGKTINLKLMGYDVRTIKVGETLYEIDFDS